MELFPSLFKMLSALLLVLGIIVLAAYGAKRFFGPQLGRFRSQSLIQVLATSYLGGKREISVVEVGEEYFVVGVTANNISLLTRLNNIPREPKPIGETMESRQT
ncbi:MAG: flagellar biosynthetic protein FliO [Nitrospiria bacterium]